MSPYRVELLDKFGVQHICAAMLSKQLNQSYAIKIVEKLVPTDKYNRRLANRCIANLRSSCKNSAVVAEYDIVTTDSGYLLYHRRTSIRLPSAQPTLRECLVYAMKAYSNEYDLLIVNSL